MLMTTSMTELMLNNKLNRQGELIFQHIVDGAQEERLAVIDDTYCYHDTAKVRSR